MGKFAVKETATGIKFNLLATNGQIIGVSEVYSGKEACLKGIESVKKNAEIANLEDQTVEPIEAATCPKFEIYNDKAGEFRFRLKATNGQVIAVSEGYKALASCENGVASVQKNAADAEIAALAGLKRQGDPIGLGIYLRYECACAEGYSEPLALTYGVTDNTLVLTETFSFSCYKITAWVSFSGTFFNKGCIITVGYKADILAILSVCVYKTEIFCNFSDFTFTEIS